MILKIMGCIFLVLIALCVEAYLTAVLFNDAEASNEESHIVLSREEQIELMKQCIADAWTIKKLPSFSSRINTAIMAAAFFEYRTRILEYK